MKTQQTFEEYLRKNNLSGNTLDAYLWTVDFYHSHYDGVTKENLLAYKGYLMEFFKPKTVNLRIQAMNKYLTYLGKEKLHLKAVKIQQKNFLENVISNADYNFLKKLDAEVGLLNLWGYAGWNTASNTLGTVMCQAVLRYLYGNTPTHRRFTAARVMDDTVYMARVRRDMLAECASGSILERSGEHTENIINRINEITGKDFTDIGDKYKAVGCYLPWNRLFEIRLEVKEKNHEA